MQHIEQMNFTYKDINVISQKQFDVHLELYKGYVTKTNEIWKILSQNPERDNSNATYSHYRGLKQGETYSLDGVILHELYFSNMGSYEDEAKIPHGVIIDMLKRDFGSYDNWIKDFIACGKAARGWTVLAYDQRSKSLNNFMSDAHDIGVIWTAYPLLVMDVYEHAYYIDYYNKKSDYIDNFIKDINWDIVNNRAKLIR